MGRISTHHACCQHDEVRSPGRWLAEAVLWTHMTSKPAERARFVAVAWPGGSFVRGGAASAARWAWQGGTPTARCWTTAPTWRIPYKQPKLDFILGAQLAYSEALL